MLSLEKGHVRGSRTTAFGEGDVERWPTAAVGPQREPPANTRARDPRTRTPMSAIARARA